MKLGRPVDQAENTAGVHYYHIVHAQRAMNRPPCDSLAVR